MTIAPEQWLSKGRRIDFIGKNKFLLERTPSGPMLRSTPQISATGIYFAVSAFSNQLRRVSWKWLVDPLHGSADIRNLPTEDFGATIMFIFGTPSFWKQDVPTVAYTWTSTPVPNETVITSRRYSSLRYMQLRGRIDAGKEQHEIRNVGADFQKIFGQPAPALHFVAIFNDNDQTRQPVSALFGAVVMVAQG